MHANLKLVGNMPHAVRTAKRASRDFDREEKEDSFTDVRDRDTFTQGGKGGIDIWICTLSSHLYLISN